MLTSITLKCSNRGANLQISPEMSNFACGYCGASQMVERSGGTVSLKLLTNAISQVQAGTDKTAAELAINRLKGGMQDLEITYDNLNLKHRAEMNVIQRSFKVIWFIVSIVSFLFAIYGGWVLVLILIIWIAASVFILYAYNQQIGSEKITYIEIRQKLFEKEKEIQQRIQQHKKIVDT